MLGGLAAYLLNFLAGKNKNSKLAHSWLAAHRQLLEDNFSIIGQDSTHSAHVHISVFCSNSTTSLSLVLLKQHNFSIIGQDSTHSAHVHISVLVLLKQLELITTNIF